LIDDDLVVYESGPDSQDIAAWPVTRGVLSP